jgi:hypothetical protein
MLREIIRPTKKQIEIKIPEEYIGREIEILVLPFFEIESPAKEENHGYDENLLKLFKNAPNIKTDKNVDIDALMNEVNDVVL